MSFPPEVCNPVGYWLFVFHGTSEHEAMLWRVIRRPDGRWALEDSYDEGKVWIHYCTFKTHEECKTFVEDWLSQF